MIALSMLITPLLFILYDCCRATDGDRAQSEPDEIDEQAPVIIAGIGRFGQIVNRLVRASGFKTVVLDSNLETIQLMRRFGVKGFLGDPTRPELLQAAGLAKAPGVGGALDDAKKQPNWSPMPAANAPICISLPAHTTGTHVVRCIRPGPMTSCANYSTVRYVPGVMCWKTCGLSEFEAAGAEQTFYAHDRMTVRELAEVWDPNLPASENEAYVARAKELEKDLETALLNLAEENAQKSA